MVCHTYLKQGLKGTFFRLKSNSAIASASDATKFFENDLYELTTLHIRDGFITKGELKLANKKSSMKEITQVGKNYKTWKFNFLVTLSFRPICEVVWKTSTVSIRFSKEQKINHALNIKSKI